MESPKITRRIRSNWSFARSTQRDSRSSIALRGFTAFSGRRESAVDDSSSALQPSSSSAAAPYHAPSSPTLRSFWVPVEDDDVWALAVHAAEDGGVEAEADTVTLIRRHAPTGVPATLRLPRSGLAELTPASSTAAEDTLRDLGQLSDVNMGAVLHVLRCRHDADRIFTLLGRERLRG